MIIKYGYIKMNPVASLPAWMRDIEQRRRCLGVSANSLSLMAGVGDAYLPGLIHQPRVKPPADWPRIAAALSGALDPLERIAADKIGETS